jgi:hypothetical protein
MYVRALLLFSHAIKYFEIVVSLIIIRINRKARPKNTKEAQVALLSATERSITNTHHNHRSQPHEKPET